jgi:hypothetical protein
MGKQVKDLEPTDEKGALDAVESMSLALYICWDRGAHTLQAMRWAST